MKKGLIFLIVVITAGAVYFVFSAGKKDGSAAKQQTLSPSQHSDTLNAAINNTLAAYSALTEAFINWDTAAVATASAHLNQSITAIHLDELKKDSAVYEKALSYIPGLKNNLTIITTKGDIAQKRKVFNTFSQTFYHLLRTVQYDRSTLYLQECPMAFNNETEAGMWVSRQEAIRNPYMGLHHPKYGKAMMECGDIKDSINFTKFALR